MSGPPDGPPRHDVATTLGTAQVRVFAPAAQDARGTLLLGHGAGGQRDAADVLALTGLTQDGWTVVLVDQPWRVAGRTVATPPPSLDRAWLEVVHALGGAGVVRTARPPVGAARPAVDHAGAAPDGTPLPHPWVYGGRSAGARVAARTSATEGGSPVPGVAGVLALAFPLHPPGRPDRSRADELARPLGAGLPTLVVQGARDPMGTPEEIRDALQGVPTASLELHAVPGTHSPSRDLGEVLAAAHAFLAGLR